MQTLVDVVKVSAQVSVVFHGQFLAAILMFISPLKNKSKQKINTELIL